MMKTTEMVAVAGSSAHRRGARKQIALSEVEIKLDTDEAVEKCLRALEASDIRLAETPQMYDWVTVWKDSEDGQPGATIRFGVAWYDRSFYDKNRNIYLANQHLRMFAGFGDGAQEVSVKHFELAA